MNDKERLIQLETVINSHKEELIRGREKFINIQSNFQKSMDSLRDHVTEETGKIRGDFNTFQLELFDKLDKRYASKTTEKIVYAVGSAVLLSVVASVLTLVVN